MIYHEITVQIEPPPYIPHARATIHRAPYDEIPKRSDDETTQAKRVELTRFLGNIIDEVTEGEICAYGVLDDVEPIDGTYTLRDPEEHSITIRSGETQIVRLQSTDYALEFKNLGFT